MVDSISRRPVRILMLEDSALDAEIAIARLRRSDIVPEVTLASGRGEFERALLARPYDLILADYALPDFDGVAALAMAREKLPLIPFIFISGRVGEEVAIDTLQRGATDYVLKHRLERLVPAVVRALKESEEHETRMQMEAMFRESEQRFHHVIDAVPQLVWVADAGGALRYSNRAWKSYASESVVRWCDRELFEPSDFDGCMAAWHYARERNEPFTCEARLLRSSDRTYRWHLLRIAPMALPSELSEGQNASQEVEWLGTATDVEERKLNEEALRTAEKLSVTGRMAAAIAHEINNPLESLTNLLFLVRLESEGNERALSFLDMTENELERISSITKQTLQFYRDSSLPSEVDAREILAEVLRLFATRLTAKGIAVSFDVEPGIVFEAIKGEIRQVLINLITNAIDAVQPKGAIDLEVHRVEHNNSDAVEITVFDNGYGVAPAQAEKLFEPFFSTKGAHGTGLGLWVSKGIVEKHGGSLHLSSSGSDGSKARTAASLVLPVKAKAELSQAGAGSESQGSTRSAP